MSDAKSAQMAFENHCSLPGKSSIGTVTSLRRLVCVACVASALLTVSPAQAATISRDSTTPNNAADLNLGAGWVGGTVPGSGDIAAFWDAATTETDGGGTQIFNPSPVLGGDLSWLGITVNANHFRGLKPVINYDDPVSEANTHILTLGAQGINVTGNRGVPFNNDFALAADQTWTNSQMTANKAIIANGAVDLGVFTLTLSGKGGKTFNGPISGTGGLNTSTQSFVNLSAINRYTGDTTVIGGTTNLLDNARLKFVIGADGVNNWITSNGVGDNADLTFGAQSACIIPPGPANAQPIAMFDLWRPDDLRTSGYVWLPIHWEQGRMVLRWQSHWTGSVAARA